MAYRCTNYDHCGQEPETRDERANHEAFCQVPPTSPPGQDQQKTS